MDFGEFDFALLVIVAQDRSTRRGAEINGQNGFAHVSQ